MKKFDTVIFDLDGTLLNSLEDLCDSTNAALKEMGYPIRTLDEIRIFVGNGVWKLIERAVPNHSSKEDVGRCFRLFETHYEKNKENKTRPYEGIVELLQALKKQGYKTAVISNKYHEAVCALTAHYFGNFFDVSVGEKEGIPKKPAPDGIKTVLKSLNSDSQNAIMVGDSDVDILTAKNAGLKSVGVTWGFRTKELLKKVGADYIIDEPKALLDLLQ
ncbi:HAD family hydrolase [Anaerovorax sp. IOR16]|uniref:HAD family hydrolase n=1 Tax=Anaerovorax sp. IOR16 TaxID=2773458 RepID=UPI0019CFA958|nr:HAD family hydrolase [Anaerovorax sp. IOR16]